MPSRRSAGGAGSARAGRAATAASAQLQARCDREAHVGHVDLQGRGLFVQVFFYDKRIAGNIQHLVRFARLIQSQRQSGASSAAGREIDPDRAFFFFGEIAVQLGLGAFRQFDHDVLLEQPRSMQLSITDRKVKWVHPPSRVRIARTSGFGYLPEKPWGKTRDKTEKSHDRRRGGTHPRTAGL